MTWRQAILAALCAIAPSIAQGKDDGPGNTSGPAPGIKDLVPVNILTGWMYEGPFRTPAAVHCDAATGEVYVADRSTNTIGVFDANGVPLFAFGDEGMGEPRDLTVDAAGRIYLLDNDGSRVKVYNARGVFQSDLALPPLGSKNAPGFTAIAFDAGGDLYLGDSRNAEVVVLDRKLRLKMRLRSSGPKPFSHISGIAFDERNIYVADQDNLAIQVFDRVGRYLRGWGEHEAGLVNVSLPHGIAIDAKGRVILIDTLRQEVKFFQPTGEFMMRLGGAGTGPGQIRFATDVCIDRSGRLWIADTGNVRVQVLVPVDLERPRDPASHEGEGEGEGDAPAGEPVAGAPGAKSASAGD